MSLSNFPYCFLHLVQLPVSSSVTAIYAIECPGHPKLAWVWLRCHLCRNNLTWCYFDQTNLVRQISFSSNSGYFPQKFSWGQIKSYKRKEHSSESFPWTFSSFASSETTCLKICLISWKYVQTPFKENIRVILLTSAPQLLASCLTAPLLSSVASTEGRAWCCGPLLRPSSITASPRPRMSGASASSCGKSCPTERGPTGTWGTRM